MRKSSDLNSKIEEVEAEKVDLATICDSCGEMLPIAVWGAREAICPNCGRKLECC